jgi:hypothetical protein
MAEQEPPKTLAEALVMLQAQLPEVAKTADAQYGKYADLTVVSRALLPLLASCGLSWTCRPTIMEDGGGRFVLDYALKHVSGEETSGLYPLPTTGSPQQIGSAITYARRYALCAVTGLAPGGDDDDGQAGEKGHADAKRPRNVPDSQLAAEGRMTRGEKSAHEQLARDTTGGGKAERSHPRGPDPDDPWAQDAPVDHQRAADMRVAAEDRSGSSTKEQHTMLGILYSQLEIKDRETRLIEMTDRVGRQIGSARDLSYTEAESAIKGLRALATELAAAKGGA